MFFTRRENDSKIISNKQNRNSTELVVRGLIQVNATKRHIENAKKYFHLIGTTINRTKQTYLSRRGGVRVQFAPRTHTSVPLDDN